MSKLFILAIILIFMCVFLHVINTEDKLIYPRLLLPYSSFTKVNVSLRSPERDCFKWYGFFSNCNFKVAFCI